MQNSENSKLLNNGSLNKFGWSTIKSRRGNQDTLRLRSAVRVSLST